ncbi:TonB family protein [Desulfovibrio desulfuricans]|uniref:energy transducer TonB n=1 Tax=Desulfovibrio desulfuricans TaxID=876 RepID=UPI001F48C8F1|nr:energy transducer TonB [Desulfovibrio desulfuricans]UIA99483.1 TonB family protein [Desulfovibrio desulfuricans]
MLPFDYPPPRRSKRLFVRWLGYSAILHAVLAACLLAGAYALPRYLPVQSGGAVMVSLAGVGSSLAGEVGLQAQAAGGMTEDVSVTPPMTETAAKAEQTVAEAAVPVKKHSVKPKQAERPAGNHKAQPSQYRQEQSAQPKPQQVTTASGQSAQADLPVQSGGDGGQGSASSGSGPLEQATGAVQGDGSPHPQVMPWNAQGGPRFLRQAPLRYPRAAQRRNLEGKAVVEAYLDMQGKLLRARVLQADHEDFADAALACVQSSSFKPAQREGKAIPCVVRIPMLFVLKGL